MNKFLKEGVWFQSSVAGLFYANHAAAGDIHCVVVDGQRFYKKTEAKYNKSLEPINTTEPKTYTE